MLEAITTYPKAWLLMLVASASLLWVGYSVFWRGNFGQKIYKAYALYAGFMILWILSNAYFQSPLLTLLGMSLAIGMALFANIVCVLGIITAFYYSCLLSSAQCINSWAKVFIIVSVSSTFMLNLTPGLTVIDVEISEQSKFQLTQGPCTLIFFGMAALTILLTSINFLSLTRKTTNITHQKMQYMMWGVICVLLSILAFDIFIPLFFKDYSWVWLPPVFSITEIVLFGYGLLCKRFLSLKITAQTLLAHGASIASIALPFILALRWLQDSPPLAQVTVMVLLACLASCYWLRLLAFFSRQFNYLLYHKTTNPIDDIKAATRHFQHSMTHGLQQMAAALNVGQAQFAPASDGACQPFSHYFLEQPGSDLVRDELAYTLTHETNNQAGVPAVQQSLVVLKQAMDAQAVGLVLPVYNGAQELMGLLLFQARKDQALFSIQEINALKIAAVQAAIYLGWAVQYQQAVAEHQQTKKRLLGLAGSIAHEMRTPLSQLKGVLFCIQHDLPLPTEQSQTAIDTNNLNAISQRLSMGFRAIDKSAQVITMTLNEINDQPINPNTFEYLSAKQTTELTLHEYGYQNDSERQRVVFAGEDFTFKGDDTLYTFVLFNLLKNALFYTTTYPDAKITVTVRPAADGQPNRVLVRDTGPGIPQQALPQLFDSFYTAGKKDGTGLGLAYCKRVMTAFGGDISCDSVEGEYTEFCLTFPAVSPAELQAYHQPAIEQARPHLDGKRVLIVDDQATNREVARNYLAPFAVIIDDAEDGEQAIKILKERPYDLVVMDIQMPELDGYQVTQQIRAGLACSHPTQAIPVLGYGYGVHHGALPKALKVGMQRLQNKPCSQKAFLQSVTTCIEKAADELANETN